MGHPLLSGVDNSNFTGVSVFRAIVTLGASDVSTVQTRDITSITRTTNGTYKITLPRIYRTLVGFHVGLIDAAGAVYFPVVATNSVDSDGTLTFEMRTEAGTATDVDNGSKMLVRVEVSNDPFNDATV